jgi:hypothetical protein
MTLAKKKKEVVKMVKAKFLFRKWRYVEEDGERWSEPVDAQQVVIEARTPLELYAKMQNLLEEMREAGYTLSASTFNVDEDLTEIFE